MGRESFPQSIEACFASRLESKFTSGPEFAFQAKRHHGGWGEWRSELSYSRYNLLLAAFSRERNETYVARANFSFVFRVEEYVGMRILILKIPPAIDT